MSDGTSTVKTPWSDMPCPHCGEFGVLHTIYIDREGRLRHLSGYPVGDGKPKKDLTRNADHANNRGV